MKELRIRHHHLLCTSTFVGHGYDGRFVSNMKKVVSILRSPEELVIHLDIRCDDLCSSCPHAVRGVCKDHTSVVGKDRSAARFLSLPEEGSFPAGPLLDMVKKRLRALDDIHLVCGECEWADLCNARLSTLRATASAQDRPVKKL